MAEEHETSSLWPEDTVQYKIYYTTDEIESGDHVQLPGLILECNHLVRQLSSGHVWNHAPFKLRRFDNGTPPHLVGMTFFRDNIQDEWIIVHLLFCLSEKFSDLVISVEDGDGQFLLVEAAHFLEKWMKPEAMKNRVFICDGAVHIVPIPRSPADIGRLPVATPSISEAVRLVRSEEVGTRASEDIQASISRRLARYKDKNLKSFLHRAHCHLPSLAAHVLSCDHQLVAAACHAIVDRMPSDMQACKRMEHFSPKRYDMLTSEVFFTQFLYAKLTSLRFSAPRNSGFSIPHSENHCFKEYDLGMKLTCGLEILAHQAKARGSISKTYRARDHPKWPIFMENLKRQGYFQSELEGSRKYQERLASAEDYFLNHCQQDHEEEFEDIDPMVAAGQKILHILQEEVFSEDEIKQRVANLSPPDDDSWMSISEEELDSMLKQTSTDLPSSARKPSTTTTPPTISADQPLPQSMPPTKSTNQPLPQYSIATPPTKSTNQPPTKATPPTKEPLPNATPLNTCDADLQSLVFGMKSFMENVSSHTGAEFPWHGDDPSNSSGVEFDPESFMHNLNSMLESKHETVVQSESDSDDSLSLSDSEDDGQGETEEQRCEEMEELMRQMDQELAASSIGQSFQQVKSEAEESLEESQKSDPSAADLQPLDIDFNLVKNLLDSYTSQRGEAGPGSNILHSLGLNIPEQN